MTFQNRKNSKRIAKIVFITISLFILGLIALGMYGSSTVSRANDEQCALIEGYSIGRSASQVIKSNSNSSNVFVFDKGKLKVLNKTIEIENELRNLKISKKVSSDNAAKIDVNVTIKDSNSIEMTLGIDYKNLDEKILSDDTIPAGIYKAFGYSLSETMKSIKTSLDAFKEKAASGIVGVAFLNKTGYLFFYEFEKNGVEVVEKFYGIDGKVDPVDIFGYFLTINDSTVDDSEDSTQTDENSAESNENTDQGVASSTSKTPQNRNAPQQLGSEEENLQEKAVSTD